ncbi:MAG TPA: hypothetical protein VLI05_02100 [Candidatus Saccharimonadia bacterium]|nr:hypothetical protein [Candidatus Saccharimonadia bacterium]
MPNIFAHKRWLLAGVAAVALVVPVGYAAATASPAPSTSPSPSVSPSPSPRPSTSPSPSPSPAPSAPACGTLTATPKGGDLNSLIYIFTITPTGEGPSGYRLELTNSAGAKQDVDLTSGHQSTEFTFAQSGTYTVTGQVKGASGFSAASDACTVQVTAGSTSQTPAPAAPATSASPAVLGTSSDLPATGPEGALAGVAGLTAMGYAARSYLRSRKSLVGSLRRR